MKVFDIGGALNFKGARINIVANSDNHGSLVNLPDFYNAIKQNEQDIFQKSEEKSTLNLYINVGDYFINPSKKGWITYPDKNSGEVQAEFLQTLVTKVHKVANTTAYNLAQSGEPCGGNKCGKANFEAIYTPGNHCFDGGDRLLYGLLSKINGLTTVMSNVDVEYSPLFKKELEKENSNFKTSKIFEIPDDKDENKKHHLMVLGATIPAMDFYNPGLLEGTNFCDVNAKKDAKMGKDDIKNTIEALRVEIEDFKKKHPKGIIILSSHMGTKLSKIVRDEIPGITEILDGHKHDVATISKGGTSISSLGMDNDIVKSISLVIDDNGDIDERETRTYSSEQYRLEKSARKTNSIYRLLSEGYAKDEKPLIRIFPTENSFDYKPEIRYGDSALANFLTTSVGAAIRNINGQENLDAVGVQSSIIRGGLKNGSNNFDILKVFDGVSEDLSDVKIGIITGEELVLMILENVRDNIKDPSRNTIIQWSDIQINRGEIAKALVNKPNLTANDAVKFIKIRKDNEGNFKKINIGKDYKIAIADKYLQKTDINTPKLIGHKFKSIGQTYHNLFKNYLECVEYGIIFQPEYSEDRVIDED